MNLTCSFYGRTEFVLRLDNKSRMSREVHVRFRESLGVQFPRATRLVIGFERKGEAEACLEDLRARFAKFGLKLHETKTRLIEFGRFAIERRKERDEGKPETFDFLGFTHRCGKTRSHGWFTIARESIAKRMRAKLAAVKELLRRRRHWDIGSIGRWLSRVIQGWYNYHAILGNMIRLQQFRDEITKLWLCTLRNRLQRHRWTWSRMQRLVRRVLPTPRIIHPYPDQRFRDRLNAGAV